MKRSSTFGKHFLWGASTSSHQVEGNTHNQWTVWELENARSLANQAHSYLGEYQDWADVPKEAGDPRNYISGRATDHLNRYEEDFDLLEKMNMNAFRFGIEWSRVEPEQGVWDPAALAHYKRYLKELRKRGIEPLVTLFHFTLPVWFADMGGFERRSNIKYFTRYVEKIIQELGSDMKYIITINEPEIYASCSYFFELWPPAERNAFRFWRVYSNLAAAHNRSAKLIHRLNRRYKVSIAKHSLHLYAGDSTVLSRLSVRVARYFSDDYFLKKVAKNCDFIGLNYYQSIRIFGYAVHNIESPRNDLQWPMIPGDIDKVIMRLHDRYKLPIIVTENGLADAADKDRRWWIEETLKGLQRAIDRGADVKGYLHWSLTDNFEWAYGKWPRFGLAHVDYKTGKRTLRPSAVWFGSVIKKLRNS